MSRQPIDTSVSGAPSSSALISVVPIIGLATSTAAAIAAHAVPRRPARVCPIQPAAATTTATASRPISRAASTPPRALATCQKSSSSGGRSTKSVP